MKIYGINEHRLRQEGVFSAERWCIYTLEMEALSGGF